MYDWAFAETVLYPLLNFTLDPTYPMATNENPARKLAVLFEAIYM